MKRCVIFNPVARGDKARRFQSHLEQIAREATLKPTTCAGDARRLAAEAVGENYDVIIAAGGDGTLNEVLNGIGDAGGLQHVRLGVLPFGTTNVFAKELGLPLGFNDAWAVIRREKEMAIDVPWSKCIVEGRPHRRYFAQMAGAGLDSRAIELLNWELKKRIGYFAYVVAALQALSEKQPQIEISNGRETARGELVLIGNGKFYGGRFTVFPLADLCDGVLEAVVFPKLGLEAIARSCWGLVTDNFHSGGKTIQLKGNQIEVRCAKPIPFHLDGENAGPLPATFGIESRALKVLVP